MGLVIVVCPHGLVEIVFICSLHLSSAVQADRSDKGGHPGVGCNPSNRLRAVSIRDERNASKNVRQDEVAQSTACREQSNEIPVRPPLFEFAGILEMLLLLDSPDKVPDF